MRKTFLLCAGFIISLAGISQNQTDEQSVKQVANSWFNSFNKHDYSDISNYTTEDCYMINPYGLHGKHTNETPAMFKKVHEALLKNVSIKVDSMTIRFIKPDVAIATVLSQQTGAYYLPDGIDRGNNKHQDERLITTMVIVKQNDKWLITQYQNTIIATFK
ncbi:SgcJ/EcaC family oxidoreductase [Danxiaibacter flavus]|uniref:SgcJ/EcaC family oxidoreductase n=1 Tax=Danxiaibacter flavus TaxID=3049108 RepID=A0ABV3ZBT3_9BACT|nr:SgcJ/EcaC family oxidoreductase [Chitinophagaceae bacterium DXS]